MTLRLKRPNRAEVHDILGKKAFDIAWPVAFYRPEVKASGLIKGDFVGTFKLSKLASPVTHFYLHF